MRIIAIPTIGENIEDHFGQCKQYTIVKVNDEGTIISKELYDTPQGCGCKSNLAEVLAEKGVRLMIAGNMGQGAKNVLADSGIKVMCGFSGNIDNALNRHLLDGFEGDETMCQHHHHHHHGDHQCQH